LKIPQGHTPRAAHVAARPSGKGRISARQSHRPPGKGARPNSFVWCRTNLQSQMTSRRGDGAATSGTAEDAG
jgi:hypothetical protein